MSDPDLFETDFPGPFRTRRRSPCAIDNSCAAGTVELVIRTFDHALPGLGQPIRGGQCIVLLSFAGRSTLVNGRYLPQFPGARHWHADPARIDFAIVDVHPASSPRSSFRNPVPIFGLIYLNREAAGRFSSSARRRAAEPAPGYVVDSRDGFELCGRIEPVFNRLVIYPGFVPHSGEIAGDRSAPTSGSAIPG